MLQALSGPICPDTVLLFEPRISYPALRVTEINFLFRFDRFLKQFVKKIAKKIEKIEFFKFSNFVIFFPEIFRIFFRSFDLAITYREFWNLAQKIRHDSLYPKIK